jgi:hypothetical protein
MATRRRTRHTTPLPAALPPETRTVGQLVAETIKLYGADFWRVLPLGLPLAALDWLAYGRSSLGQTLLLWAFGPLLTAAFVWASALATHTSLERRSALTSFVVGLIVFVPFPVLLRLWVLPGLALFALVGLAVPAALVERLGVVAALRRGLQLGRAHAVHALGGLATLVIVYGVSRAALLVLLHSQGDQAVRVATFLADVVLAPLIFLGAGLLYVDQRARVTLAAPDRGEA